MRPGVATTFDVDVYNSGARPWPAAGERNVALSYHWRDEASGRLVVYDGLRTLLPHDIEPGATIRLHAAVRAPAVAGRYRLHLEMVHEGITWFGEQGDVGYDAVVNVVADAPAVAAALPAVTPPRAVTAPLERGAPRRMLWRARTALGIHGAASVGGLFAAGATIGLATYLVHGCFDYFLEFTPTYGLLWLLAGLVVALSTTTEHARAPG